MSRIKGRGINGRKSVRFLRAWRGHKVGDVISPPGGMRKELLRQTDQLGNKIAEEVVEKVEKVAAKAPASPDESKPRKKNGAP